MIEHQQVINNNIIYYCRSSYIFIMCKSLIIIVLLSFSLVSSPVEDTYLNKYQLVIVTLNNKGLVLARCNTQTGEGHYRLGGKWYKGVESTPIGNSLYKCSAQAFGENEWILVRMDLNSGKIWTLQNEVWRVILE